MVIFRNKGVPAKMRDTLARHWDPFSDEFDLESGFRDLLEGAKGRDLYSMACVGRAYLLGRGVEKDEEQAEYWFGRVAERLITWADGRWRHLSVRRRVIERGKDPTVGWLMETAELGEPMSCYIVGMKYYKGSGVKQDYKLALKYLTKALSFDIDSMVKVGDLCAKGLGCRRDFKKAIKYFNLLDWDEYSRLMAIISGLGPLWRKKAYELAVEVREKALRPRWIDPPFRRPVSIYDELEEEV